MQEESTDREHRQRQWPGDEECKEAQTQQQDRTQALNMEEKVKGLLAKLRQPLKSTRSHQQDRDDGFAIEDMSGAHVGDGSAEALPSPQSIGGLGPLRQVFATRSTSGVMQAT